jgi:hypothetical protein
VDDVAITVVSYNSARWIRSCLRTILAHIGPVRADVVVVDADSRGFSVSPRELPESPPTVGRA